MEANRTGWVPAVVLMFAVTAAACGGTDSGAPTTDAPVTTVVVTTTAAPVTTAAPADKIRIAIILGLTGDSFYGTFACGAQDAADELGVDITFQGVAEWGYDLQQPILDAVLLQDPDGIGWTPHDFEAPIPWIEERIAEGIPVITFDVIVEPNVATQGMATHPELGGALAASKVAETAADGGSVGVFGAVVADSRRIRGFLDGGLGEPGLLELRPDLNVLPTVFTENDPAVASSGAAALIQANPDLEVIYTDNGTNAQGVASAIAAAGLEEQIDLITWDLFPDFLADLKSGVLDGLVGQQPRAMGVTTVTNLVGIIRGDIDPNSLEQTVNVPSIWVNRDNVDDPDIVSQFYVAEC